MSLLVDPMKFWLIAARLTGFFMISPGMNEIPIPRPAKTAFMIWMTLVLLPVIPSNPFGVPNGWDSLLLLSGEVFVGMAMGLVGRMIFATFQFGGSIIDSEVGLLAGQQLNPLSPIHGGVFGQILFIVGLIYFWTLDYFSVLILAIHESFRIVPLASAVHSLHNVEIIAKLGASLFAGGLMIAAPIMAVMFFLTIAVGLLSRAVQGINIFAEAFTMKILVGLGAILLFLPLLLLMVRDQLERLIPFVTEMLKHTLSVSRP